MIIIAYGANLPSQVGQPHETFAAAKDALMSCGIDILAQSSLWETAPVGTDGDQPWYTNAVLSVATDLPPLDLLKAMGAVEAQFGRVRTIKNAARPIDLDLIDYQGRVIMDAPDLILPHPRMSERAFVLKPLEEIAENWIHPVSGLALAQLIADLPPEQSFRKLAA
jgi:2-amino-4-hydroxy-6-hydroxymethyldihydropteridine diphosphokinase